MSRQLTVTLTLRGICPEAWDKFTSAEIKARAEQVSEDMARKIFAPVNVLIVAATATVEGGDHE